MSVEVKCCERIYDNWRTRACSRKAVVFRCIDGKEGEFGYCKQHDPVAVKAAEEKRQARWRAESEARTALWERERQERKALAACKAAIEQIAKGHDDPRTLALEVLEVLALFPDAARVRDERPQGLRPEGAQGDSPPARPDDSRGRPSSSLLTGEG